MRNALSNEQRDAAEQPFIANRFLRFLIAGGVAASANFGSRLLFSSTMDFEYAVIAAYVVGMVVAFTTFRTFVFEPSGRRLRYETLAFITVNIWSLTQVWLISVWLYHYGLPAIGWAWRPDMLAHGIGIASTALTSFVGHKFLTFRQSPPLE